MTEANLHQIYFQLCFRVYKNTKLLPADNICLNSHSLAGLSKAFSKVIDFKLSSSSLQVFFSFSKVSKISVIFAKTS